MRKRKIDDEKCQAMLQDGKSQREIARFFGVSDAAVSKRFKRLAGEEPPESFKSLTPKEQRFVLAKMQGKSNTQAAVEAYNVGSIESAKTIGSRLSSDPDIERALSDLLYEEGIGRRRRVQILKTICGAKDLSVAAKGIDLANKMVGEYGHERTGDGTGERHYIDLSRFEIHIHERNDDPFPFSGTKRIERNDS